MELGFTLLTWAVVGITLAAAVSLPLGGLAALFTRGVTRHRRAAVIVAGVFPFAWVMWGAALLVVQTAVSEGLLHRDAGLSDQRHAPISNGYQILMIDVNDEGWIYNPKTQAASGQLKEQEDAIAGVRVLQVVDRYVLGGVNRHAFGAGSNKHRADFYFMLDTQTGRSTVFLTYDALHQAAQKFGLQPHLEPIDAVYWKYRSSWFDLVVSALLLVPPLIGLSLIALWIHRLRRNHAG